MKIKFLMMTLLAVAGMCLVSCSKDDDNNDSTTTSEGYLALYPNGLSTNETYAKSVVAYYQTQLGTDATVTYVKNTGADKGCDAYTINFAYANSKALTVINKLKNISFTTLENQLPAANYRVDFNNVYAQALYSRNLLAGTWKGQVNGKEFTLTITDTRSKESTSESYWECPYTLTYDDQKFTNDNIVYRATYSDGKVSVKGSIIKYEGTSSVLNATIELTQGVSQATSCQLSFFQVNNKSVTEDLPVTLTK